jgi:hypothetical protein
MEKFKSIAKLILGIVAAVSAVVGIVVGVPELKEKIRTAYEETTPITITRPGGDMNRCAVFEGTAGRRHDQQLWLAHRDLRDPVHYFFMKPYLVGENGWKAIVHLGPPDTVRSMYSISVFYVSDDTSRFLDDVSTSSVTGPGGTFWMARDLPPTATGTVSIDATRAGDPRDCP